MSEEQEKEQDKEQSKDQNKDQNKAAPEEEPYSFLQETFKDEQVNGKKIRNSIWKTAGRGLVFGLAACLSFYALKPWLETKFGSKQQTVTIPKDEEDPEAEDPVAEEEQVVPVLTIENYEEINQALYQVAVGANKSVVEIRGILDKDGVEGSSNANANSVSGVIVADNGQELLILAPARVTKEAIQIQAVFSDNASYDATLKKQDKNLGLAVFSVPRSVLTDSTWGQIQTAVLGNSNLLSRGKAVIALGNQFGYSGGMGYGIISSAKNKITVADGEYKILNTDLPVAEKGSSILVNTDGEVVGIADQEMLASESGNTLSAYAISDLKEYIERLSNGKGIAYLGVNGIEITEAISTERGIPQGIYVQEVEADSPAMQAGIQSGDVITKMGKSNVTTLTNYRNNLAECEPGQEIKVYGMRQGSSEYVDIDFTVVVGSKE